MKYAYATYKENNARAAGRDLAISLKQAIEITRTIRGKSVERARAILQDAIGMKKAIPFHRFTNGLGHKPGMASGRYPAKACKEILAVLDAAEANAQNKGLGTCRVVHAAAQPAARPWHSGRRRRIKTRRAHIEIVLEETAPAKKKGKDGEKKEEKRTEKKEEIAEETQNGTAEEKKEKPKATPGQQGTTSSTNARSKKTEQLKTGQKKSRKDNA